MKKIISLFLFVLITGCASKPLVKQGPCDSVLSRNDVWVCGESDVLQKCRPVEGRAEFVCDPI